MAPTKTILSCSAVQLVWFTESKQSPLSLSVQFCTDTPKWKLKCLKDTHNYPEMRVFIISWLLKPNAKWLVSSKELLFYLPLCFIVVSYACPCVSNKKFRNLWVFSPVEKLPRSAPPPPPHPPTHETSKHGHTETSSPFWHCPPTSRSSNYSSYKTSTLLLVKPQYNNTTKHFKETTHISREK